MRLVCPNCDAEYEVDNAAIPLAGRDVQCSNCGHAWFQIHPEVEVQETAQLGGVAAFAAPEPEAVLAEAAAGLDAPPAMVVPEPEAVLHEAEAIAASAASDPVRNSAVDVFEAPPPPPPVARGAEPEATAPAPRNIDESVLAVLREEAAREAAARRAETPPALETQTEMPLEPGSNRRTGSRSDEMPAATRLSQPAFNPVPEAVRSRGDRLPAIDEINSTLRATSNRAGDVEDDAMTSLAPRRPARGGFGRGFLSLFLLGVIILALYVFAPLIAVKVPALAGVANAYVMAVNAARVWLDDRVRALIGILRSFTGGGAG